MCPDSAVINHPVHIITKEIHLSPSAFIPFCDFGGEMSTVGAKIHQFDVPVCNAFEARLFNDQLCYEVDLDKFSDGKNIENELDLGFNFIMDYNEDRQVILDDNTDELDISFGSKLDSANDRVEGSNHNDAFIYLNTIGDHCTFQLK